MPQRRPERGAISSIGVYRTPLNRTMHVSTSRLYKTQRVTLRDRGISSFSNNEVEIEIRRNLPGYNNYTNHFPQQIKNYRGVRLSFVERKLL